MRTLTNNIAVVIVCAVCLVILIAGVAVGIRWIGAGRSYQHFDAQQAHDMLEYLKDANPAHYAKIIGPDDSTYLNNLMSTATTYGDRATIALGILILFGSILISTSFLFSAVVLIHLRTIQRELQLITGGTGRKDETQEITPEIAEPEIPEEPQPTEPLHEELTTSAGVVEPVVPEEPEETAPPTEESEEPKPAVFPPEEPPSFPPDSE